MDLLLTIPVALSCEIVGKWLCLKDVVHLDTAFCHTSERQSLHKSVFKSPHCVLLHAVNPLEWQPEDKIDVPESDHRIEWIASRELRVSAISLSVGSSGLIWKPYLQQFGKFVTFALFKTVRKSKLLQYDMALQLVYQYCSNVNSVAFVGGRASRFQFEQLCSLAGIVSIDAYDLHINNNPEVQPMALCMRQLKSARLEWGNLNSIYCTPANVTRLSLVISKHVPFMSAFRNLRTLCVSCYDFTNDGVCTLFTECPWVINLELLNADEYVLVAAAERLHHIRSLRAENYCMITDYALQVIAHHHQHTLVSLYIYVGCESAIADGTSHILSVCVHLQAFSYDYTGVINFYLMQYLTALKTDFPPNDIMWTDWVQLWNLEKLQIVYTEEIRGWSMQ